MPRPLHSEDAILQRVKRASTALPPKSHPLALAVGDDAALWAPRKGHQTILTCDWFLEGTHFLRYKHSADAIGWKCLARAVSDVAAMGGNPRCFLLGLALPATHTGSWLDEFLEGLQRAARRFGCLLAGGDTTLARKILLNVTVVGEVRAGHALVRSGARPDDILYVSGQLGAAELGLRLLRSHSGLAKPKDPNLRRHLYPEPRLELGRWLAEKRIATAMVDLSDGLSSDLPRLCAASRVGAVVETSTLPGARPMTLPVTRFRKHPKVGADALRLALNGGDDYELLFTVPPKKAQALPHSFKGIPLTAIGVITHRRKIVWIDPTGRIHTVRPGGWDPFRRSTNS
jgi:thiamine-monophosphate kinase